MGKSKKQRRNQEIERLQLQKRQGIIKIVLAVALFIIVAAVRQGLLMSHVEWVTNTFVSMGIFIFAMGMALLAGIGGRDYSRANMKLRQMNAK